MNKGKGMKTLQKIALGIAVTLYANALSLSELKKMPKSIERDFYIWRFLKKEDTAKFEALEASNLIFRINSKLDKAFFKKTGMHLKKKRFKPYFAYRQRYKKLLKECKKSKTLFEGWQKLNGKDKLIFFNLAGRENRALLNKNIDKNTIYNISKYYTINGFIYRIFKEKLYNLQNSLLNVKPAINNKISYDNLMILGFKNLKQQSPKKAKWFFYSALFKAPSRFYADRAIFWIYMSTKDTKYLHKLANSYDYNLYKLIALDFLDLPYPAPKSRKIDNAKTDLNISDPIAWAKLKKKIFSGKYNLYALAEKYNNPKTFAYYYYILNKATRDKEQFFPIPYKDILRNYSINRQAMLLAIARQESHFIPASISSSFAVGMMQFMPFLVKHIAKVRGESVRLEDMFNPRISLKFANTHLNYLNKYLYHPLFVAYAYNAGIGYTRRLIKKEIFRFGPYEPYISLELVDNKQANHYGKKVLANYVIYRKLLKSPVKITDLINQLPHPKLTDSFRFR